MPPPSDMAFWLGQKYSILGKTAEGEYQRNIAEAYRSREEGGQVAPNAAAMRALQAAQSGLYGEEAADLRMGRYPSDAILGQIHDRLFGPQSGQQQPAAPEPWHPPMALPSTAPVTIQRGLGGPAQTYTVPKYDPLLDTSPGKALPNIRPNTQPPIRPNTQPPIQPNTPPSTPRTIYPYGAPTSPDQTGPNQPVLPIKPRSQFDLTAPDTQLLRKGSANVKAKGGKSGGKSGKGGGAPQGLEQILPALMAASQASQMGGGAVGPQAGDSSEPLMAPGAAAPATQPPGMRRGMANVMGYQEGTSDIGDDSITRDYFHRTLLPSLTSLSPMPGLPGTTPMARAPTAPMSSLTQIEPAWHPPMALPSATQPQTISPRGPAGVDRYESREHYAILSPEQMRQIHSILYDDPMRMVNLPGGATARPGAAPGDIWYPASTPQSAAASAPSQPMASVPLPPPRPVEAPSRPAFRKGTANVKAPPDKGNGKGNGKAKGKTPAKASGPGLPRGLTAILPQLLAAAQQGGGPPGGLPMAPGGPAPPQPPGPPGMAMGSASVMDPRSAHSAPGYPFGAGYLFGATAVPGQGSGTVDKVPAMLAPHEAVLNRAAADMMGRGKIAALNAAGAQQMGLRRGAR